MQVGRLWKHPSPTVKNLCLQLKIISYLDNDKLNKPNTGNSQVYVLEISNTMTKDLLIKQYPKVLRLGIGLLEGKYHIHIEDNYQPVQHAPRRVPVGVAIRDKLRGTLDQLTQQGTLKPATELTD